MKLQRVWALGGLLLGLALPAAAGPPDPPFMRHLYPPELVMRSQHEISLSAAQRETITQAIQETQGRVVEIQWTLQEEARKLGELLAAPDVDADAALAQLGRVLELEAQVKQAHMGLLIRIKGELSPEQRRRLDALRSEDDGAETRGKDLP